MHSLHESVASLGNVAGTAAGTAASGNTVQIDADLTGSVKEGVEARVQAGAARPGGTFC